MKKALCVLSLLTVAAIASADVQIFFTPASAGSPWAAAGPANVFAPSANNSLDYTSDGYVPNFANFPAAMGNAMIDLDANPNDFAYVWIKFTTTNGLPVVGAKLQGLDVDLLGGTPADIAYYVQDDQFGTGLLRWNGDSGGPTWPNFKKDPQTLVSVTSAGIRVLGADNASNLYQGSTRTALLGAVKVGVGTYTYELGPLGINFHTGGTPVVEFGTLTVIPEPAAVVLLGLAGLLIRRR
ncbi:MAG: hypothetical protein AB1716_17465 [Planctomycetota bacterium]